MSLEVPNYVSIHKTVAEVFLSSNCWKSERGSESVKDIFYRPMKTSIYFAPEESAYFQPN
jgi:hypothetical protein